MTQTRSAAAARLNENQNPNKTRRTRNNNNPTGGRNAHQDSQDSFLPTSSSSMPTQTPKMRRTGLSQTNHHEHNPIALPLQDGRQTTAKAAVRLSEYVYAQILDEYGYDGIINAAWEESRNARPMYSFFNDPGSDLSRLAYWLHECALLLADIPLELPEAILDGTLAQKVLVPSTGLARYFKDDRLERWVSTSTGPRPDVNGWLTRLPKPYCPAFYMRVFVDSRGHSPTPVQLRTVVQHLQMYISGNADHAEICASIDNQTRHQSSIEDIEQAFHHHLRGSDARAEVLLTFVTALSKVLETSGGGNLENQPVAFTFKYFGFTANHAERQKAHDRRNTSWLKALFDDVCRYLFRDEENRPIYAFQHYVVGYPTSGVECQLGEELLCRIGGGYYYTGLGFNIQNAGISVSSGCLKDVTHFEAVGMWNECERARYSVTRTDDQYQADVHKYSQKYYQEVAEVNAPDREYEALVEEGK